MQKGTQRLVFVGTYTEDILFGTGQIFSGQGEGIYAFFFDEVSATMSPASVNRDILNPSYIAIHKSRNLLFAVNECKNFDGSGSGAVSSFRVVPETGELVLINQVSSMGTDPCHLSLDASGRWLFVANFASGCLGVISISDDGQLSDMQQHIIHRGSSVDPTRQNGPHAHAVTTDPSNQFLYVPDLGMDAVVVYRLGSDAELTEVQKYITMPGAGPRQIVFHPFLSVAFLVNELNSTIDALHYFPDSGRIESFQTISTLPEDVSIDNTCAEIQISPDGSQICASNRGNNSIALFNISPIEGRLTSCKQLTAGGETPRNFDIHPRGQWIAICNQDSNNIVVKNLGDDYRKDEPIIDISVPSPVCIRFTHWCH